MRHFRIVTAVTLAILLGMFVFTASVIAIRWELRQAKSKRIRAILSEGKSLGPANVEFRARMSAILQREPKGYQDFQTQRADLAVALNNAEPTLSKGRNLLDRLDEEYADYPDALSFVALFKQLGDEDAKIFSYLREEISCSKTLAQLD